MKRNLAIVLCLLLTVVSACAERETEDLQSPTALASPTETAEEPERSFEVEASPSLPNLSPEPNTGGLRTITITVGGQSFKAELYDNETADELLARLPLTLDMSELNGNEKYYYFEEDFPTAAERPAEINSGDIMLYGSTCLVLFYETFPTSYSYTRIGYVTEAQNLAEALGGGEARVTFEAD
ncbi:MAG: cyclophilin-like fold protein [Clostridia bacterium]|nr:cyclophilin-like fold protein [Clostridia bacterium]